MHIQHLAASAALTAVACTSGAVAQNYVVSPAPCAIHDGASSNSFPFQGPFHYQQGHGDLRGVARTFTGLAWRRDAATTTTMPARTVDLEMFMGEGNLATMATTFASSYSSPPQLVFTRKAVNLPDRSTRPDFQPAPWDINVALDTPFAYSGVQDLFYEIVIHTSSLPTSGSYLSDTYSPTQLTAAFTSSGTGCTTSNGVMKLRATITSSTTTNAWAASWAITDAPASAPTSLLVGLTNPNQAVPGLCEQLYTDAALFVASGTSSSAGSIIRPSPALSVPYNPALVGFTLTAQAGALDATQTAGIPVAASNGVTVGLPPLMPVPAIVIHRIYASGQPSAVSGTFDNNSGLVTRFQY